MTDAEATKPSAFAAGLGEYGRECQAKHDAARAAAACSAKADPRAEQMADVLVSVDRARRLAATAK